MEFLKSSLSGWWFVILSFVVTTSILIIYRLKNRDQEKSNSVMKDKVVIIIGSLGNTGLAAAIKLVSLDARLILLCRKITQGVKIVTAILKVQPNASIDLRTVDISIINEIQTFVSNIYKKYKKVDVLIHFGESIYSHNRKTFEGYDVNLAANYIGPFVLTHLLLPLLNQSTDGRVINVGKIQQHYDNTKLKDLSFIEDITADGMFSSSKLALMLSMYHLAKMLKTTNITVNTINLDLIKDLDMTQYSYIWNYLSTRLNIWTKKKSTENGSKIIVHAATNSDIKMSTGVCISGNASAEILPAATDDLVAKQIYELGCKLCQIDGELILQNIEKVNKTMQLEKTLNKYCCVTK